MGRLLSGRVAREAEEDIVEGRLLEREVRDRRAVGVDRVEQRPDVCGASVGAER